MSRHLAKDSGYRQRKGFLQADFSGLSRLNRRFDMAVHLDLEEGLLMIGSFSVDFG